MCTLLLYLGLETNFNKTRLLFLRQEKGNQASKCVSYPFRFNFTCFQLNVTRTENWIFIVQNCQSDSFFECESDLPLQNSNHQADHRKHPQCLLNAWSAVFCVSKVKYHCHMPQQTSNICSGSQDKYMAILGY